MKQLAIVSLVASLMVSVGYASTVTQVGRYLVAEHQPLLEEYNLLAQTRQLRFSNEIETIGESVVYLLNIVDTRW